jgi:fumarate hydratase class II
MNPKIRIESDSLGEVSLPADALWGAQTQRAVENFPISGRRMPGAFLRTLLHLKAAAAQVNAELGCIDPSAAEAIQAAAAQLLDDADLTDHFPVDVYQTGSGTSSNMNANEVIAAVASSLCGLEVHPNDHVNFGQSSNDVIPSSIHISALLETESALLPALHSLSSAIGERGRELADVTKTGRTHLMDALPVRFDQVLGGWQAQLDSARERLRGRLPSLAEIALGGTAVGTGVNTHPKFAARVATVLSERLGLPLRAAESPRTLSLMGAQDEILALSGELRTLAAALMKVSNDLRWMNSGPLAGLAEIALPALQPGSSIMPGKVNPVIPEAVNMICARVIGNDVTLTVAGQSGNFELNVMLPVIADTILESLTLLANGMRALEERAIRGFTVNEDVLLDRLARNPILVTALNPLIGYGKAAEIAKKAYATGAAIIDVAAAETDISREQLERLLDPAKLTRGGL